jgi:DNA-directed RNA polymerase subunit L
MELVNVQTDKFNLMQFRINGIDSSVANSLRRAIMTDIPVVVFDTDTSEYIKNTTQFNNEITSNRLRCIPIYGIPCADAHEYEFILNVKNDSETTQIITTKDFKINKNGVHLSESERELIFPSDPITGDYIIVTRLKAGIQDVYDPEEINLKNKLKCTTAKENSCYTVASTVAFGNALDLNKFTEAGKLKKQELESKTPEEAKMEFSNWLSNDAKRNCVYDKFDFSLQSIGVYSNMEILILATESIIQGFNRILENNNVVHIEPCLTAMNNGIDIQLDDVGYTLGCVLSSVMIKKYMKETNILTFCAFIKTHENDSYGIIRIAFREMNDDIDELLNNAVKDCIAIYENLKKIFR